MTNKVRGIITATIEGESLNLRISTNEWCELEDEFGQSTTQLLKRFNEMVASEALDMRFLRSFFRASLLGAKPDITHEAAGALMSAHGLIEAAQLTGRVIVASMPEVKEAPPGKPKKPPVQR